MVVVDDPHSTGLLNNNRLVLGNILVAGRRDQDRDGDGFTPSRGDCDDSTAAVNPRATEICDGLDNNCDGQIDRTQEGRLLEESCYSGPPGTLGIGQCAAGTRQCQNGVWSACASQTTPVPETCNGVDEDCDGLRDEDLSGQPLAQACYTGPSGTQGVGNCSGGLSQCQNGTWSACTGET
ncbi:MAG: putative metal-binding motif-containing protein, partial [Myxococcota bacterium]